MGSYVDPCGFTITVGDPRNHNIAILFLRWLQYKSETV
jgi:hypothetical protein